MITGRSRRMNGRMPVAFSFNMQANPLEQISWRYED
jgi:hypothetical protein